MYNGYIIEIKELRPHTNADRLQIATIFGSNVVVGLDIKIGDKGIYFPSDGQLSVEYCEYNNLVRRKDADGNNVGGYLDPDERNIKAISLRGEKSDGIFMPLSSLDYCGQVEFEIGDTISVVNGHEICCKYIPRTKNKGFNCNSKTVKKTKNFVPLFAEHSDTSQLAYNLNQFRDGDQIEISLKMHGTSQRTAYLPVLQKDKYNANWFIRTLLKILPTNSKEFSYIKEKFTIPVYEYDYVCGTRRVVLEDFTGGFYESNGFRKTHHDRFVGKLWKGETVYYEVVGYTETGTPIMSPGSNKKVSKDFVKKYGDTTEFSYGCERNGNNEGVDLLETEHSNISGQSIPTSLSRPKSKLYVYRMTMTTEDGNVIEYSPDFMRYRCEQIGVDTVPVFCKTFINSSIDDEPGVQVQELAEQFCGGTDPIGKTHIREGVVVRIVNRPKFTAFKHKNFEFKVLEGIIKESADAPDMEEAQEVNI